MNKNNSIIFGLSAGQEIAKDIAKNLNIECGEAIKDVFADGEMLVKCKETVRGKNVYVVQSTCKPVHENIFELLIFLDALKRASAKRIILVMPYYGYSRQDRKAKPHEPITAKLVGSLYEMSGVTKIITFDLHSPQIEGFFNIPIDNLSALASLCNFVRNEKLSNLIIVSPDHGGVVRARELAKILGTQIAIIDKRRVEKNNVDIMNILGEVNGFNCLIIDDMIDTGNTVIKGCKALKEAGAKNIYIAATHGIFSNNAINNFSSCEYIDKVIITNTIPFSKDKLFSKLKIINIAKYLSDVIDADMNCNSIGKIYKNYTQITK